MAANNPKEITTLAACVSFLGKGSTLTDSEMGMLNAVKRWAEREVRSYIGCNITQASYTHFLPKADAYGQLSRYTPSTVLRLPEWPLRSISSLKEDVNGYFGQGSSAFPSTSALSSGTDYYINRDISGFNMFAHVVRRAGAWSTVPGSIRVNYVAGWTADELNGNVSDLDTDASDITMATLYAVAYRYNTILSMQPTQGAGGGSGPIIRERIDDYEAQFESAEAETTIDKHVSLPTNARQLLSRYRRVNMQ